mgnify:CR=1 FL=1
MSEHFDAIVIGAGQAGPPLCERLDRAGMKTVLIERNLLGGTCVNTGCIPTKALIASARAAQLARRGADFGFDAGEVRVDMAAVKRRKDEIVGQSSEGVAEWIERMSNVSLVHGHARFTAPRTVAVGERSFTADRVFLDVGSRAAVPDMPGIRSVPFLTNSTMMDVDFLPEHLVVIGGSYIGLEFAQMYRRFGSRVTVVERGERLISREDDEVSDEIRAILERDGIEVRTGADCIALGGGDGKVEVRVDCERGSPVVHGSHVLLAVGRRPNTDDLGLDEAGIETDERGHIVVDDQCRSSADGVWAMGDANGRGAFTHTSYNDYEIVAASLFDDDPRRITDRIETKLQEMVELKNVYSNSRPGLSIIKVDIKSNYWSDRLPQVWDVLRKKVADIEPSLPPGAGKPKVGDDFGYVFGFLLAVSSDGYNYAELERYVKDMRKELSVVPGVARVDLWGVQEKRIYVDVSTAQLTALGLTPEQLMQTLESQNLVVDAGRVDYLTQRIRVAPTGEFRSSEEIGDLAIVGAGADRDEIVRIRDFGTVSFGYADPPAQLLRHNGRQAIAMAIAPGAGENVVHVGQAIDRRIAELVADLPVGIDVARISWQSDQVSESIRAFMISLLEAVAIVLALLALTMGVRAGVIIGISGLVFPILGTFIVMAIMGIDLHRISLGAMIIAMGMMVDNAIVVTDGIMVRIAQGMDRKEAAIEAASGPAWPLLGATVVACMAFYPIFASSYDTGEYAGSLFTVVAISLGLSWVFCQTVAPLLCIAMLPGPKPGQAGTSPYQSPFYQRFRALLSLAIRYRVLFANGEERGNVLREWLDG